MELCMGNPIQGSMAGQPAGSGTNSVVLHKVPQFRKPLRPPAMWSYFRPRWFVGNQDKKTYDHLRTLYVEIKWTDHDT